VGHPLLDFSSHFTHHHAIWQTGFPLGAIATDDDDGVPTDARYLPGFLNHAAAADDDGRLAYARRICWLVHHATAGVNDNNGRPSVCYAFSLVFPPPPDSSLLVSFRSR
jgi:hypothetical protein